jgi:hypothetical protein
MIRRMPELLDYRPRSDRPPRGWRDLGVESLVIGIACPTSLAAAIGFAQAFRNSGSGELRGLLGGLTVLAVGLMALVATPYGMIVAYEDRRDRGGLRNASRGAGTG